MSSSSLIVLRGDSHAKSEDEFEYALSAGVKFIKLRHDPSSPHAVESARGFQSVEVVVRENNAGHRTFDVSYSERDGIACNGLRPLVFHPEGRTRDMVAWLPDTEYNRDRLARQACGTHVGEDGFVSTVFWTIVDDDVRGDIAERVERMRKAAPRVATKDEIILQLAKEKEQAEQRAAVLQREKEAAERSRKTLADIQIARQQSAELTEDQVKAIYDEVHDQQAAIVERLRTKHGEKWEESSEYKKTILPLVEARIADEKGALRAHSDSGFTDN